MPRIQNVQVLSVVDASYPPDVDVIQDLVVLRVTDEDGVGGFGECQTSPSLLAAVFAAPANRTMRQDLRSVIEGQRPTELKSILMELRSITRIVGREGVVAHALGALEIALWDLLGRQTEQPVWQLLKRTDVTPIGPLAYGTIWYSELSGHWDSLVAQLRDGLVQGLKLAYQRHGIPSPAEEAAILRRLRSEVGAGPGIYLDWQSQGEVSDLLARLDVYQEIDLGWIEEPFDRDDFNSYERLAPASATPLAAGESETRFTGFTALRDAGVTVLQPDLGRCGFGVATHVVAMANAQGLQVVPHQWGSDLNRAANLHWAIAEGLPLTERRLTPARLADELIRLEAPTTGAAYELPGRPGLGVSVPVARFGCDR